MGGGLPTHHEALLEVRVRLVSAGGGDSQPHTGMVFIRELGLKSMNQ